MLSELAPAPLGDERTGLLSHGERAAIPSRQQFLTKATLLGTVALLSFLGILAGRIKYVSWQGGSQEPVSIILTADPGTMVGVSERSILEARMTEIEALGSGEALCDGVLQGRLANQQVLLVTTGIGHDRAAVCLAGLLNKWYPLAREVIFLGTAGFSAAVGGILDSDACGQAAPAASTRLTSIGDVCVSHFATNWDCQKCTYPDTVSSACGKALCSLHGRDDLFGAFERGYVASADLSDEVLEAVKSLELPRQPPRLRHFAERYWAAMAAGTGEAYAPRPGAPKVWDYHSCGEASSDSFWVGAPYDELGRSYIADQINEATSQGLVLTPGAADDDRSGGSSGGGSGGSDGGLGQSAAGTGSATRRSTITVSAMEGVGWMSTLYYGERYLGHRHIPAVNVRGAADHVHSPLVRKQVDKHSGEAGGAGSARGQEVVWKNDAGWATDEELSEFVELGYRLAINTTSAVVLKLFEARAARPSIEGSWWLRGGPAANGAKLNAGESSPGMMRALPANPRAPPRRGGARA